MWGRFCLQAVCICLILMLISLRRKLKFFAHGLTRNFHHPPLSIISSRTLTWDHIMGRFTHSRYQRSQGYHLGQVCCLGQVGHSWDHLKNDGSGQSNHILARWGQSGANPISTCEISAHRQDRTAILSQKLKGRDGIKTMWDSHLDLVVCAYANVFSILSANFAAHPLCHFCLVD